MLLAVETVELVSQLFFLFEEELAGGIRLSSSAKRIKLHTEAIKQTHTNNIDGEVTEDRKNCKCAD